MRWRQRVLLCGSPLLVACASHSPPRARVVVSPATPSLPAPPPPGELATWITRAEAHERAQLDAALGRFARDVRVYAGAMRVQTPPGTFTEGDDRRFELLGVLVGDGHLRALDPRGEWRFEVTQPPTEPGVTRVWLSPTGAATRYAHGQCAGCAPPLRASDPVVFDGAVFEGNAWNVRERVRVHVEGSLRAVDPSSLSFSTMRRAVGAAAREEALTAFREEGAGWTRASQGTLSGSVDGGVGRCGRSVEYTAVWWVDEARPERREVRGLRVNRFVTSCCVAREDHGGCAPQSDCVAREEPRP